MSKLILIVEDDCDVAQPVADVLEASGYGPGIAANGPEALD
jgi:CheY-like chemotaxis protein